jgi:heme exporter protein A
VFRDVNFSVRAGEALLVTGPNGAGKSSLLRLVAGLLRPADGRIEFQGGEPELSLGEQALYLGHLDALKPALTVRENLAFWARFLGNGAVEPEPALAAVGLAALAQVPAIYLSAGQRRRLALARLIAVKRSIWLLDEPTAALDAAGQEMLAEVLQMHLSNGGIVLAATHGPIGLESPMELALGEKAMSGPFAWEQSS